MSTATIAKLTCTHDCPDACAVLVTVRDGRAVEVGPNPAHPVTGRHLCVKVDRYLERVYSPDRVLHPLRRVGAKGEGRFEPIGWPDAIREIVSRWQAIIGADGPAAILPYSYLGNMGTLTAFGTMHALFHRLGASRLERTVCGGQNAFLRELVGVPWTDPEHMVDARLIVVWGMDPISTSVHTWDLIQRARRNGARLIVVDPYRSRTASRADRHLRLRPGTDGALALGVLHVILREGLEDRDYVARYTTGIDELRAHVAAWTPEATAQATGLSADEVMTFAREYATTRPACIRHGVGMQRAAGAGMALRAIHCLPALAGQWREVAGGVADGRTVRMVSINQLMRPDWGGPAPRTLNMIQLGRWLTDPAMAPPIRALFVWNSNPAIIAADASRVLRGLGRDDLFTVVHDQFITDTARHADIVLPAPTMLEQDDLVGSWGINYLGLNGRAIEPLGEVRSVSDVARLLAAELGFEEPLFRMSDRRLIELALAGSAAEKDGASMAGLRADGFCRVGPPKGKALYAEGGFPTPSGKFEFSSGDLAKAGLGPLPAYVAPVESPESQPDLARRFPLRLLTLKRHHSINSSYGCLPVLRRAEPEPELEIHPDDAATRRIAHGRPVRVWNERGTVHYRATVTDRVPPGVVAVPFGHWAVGGASANTLTADRLGDIGNGPTFCDALVEVATAEPAQEER
jgi:anaerobic selenocysteine-containing dehydrogenase